MSDDEWDDDNYVAEKLPIIKLLAQSNKWEGEDEDEADVRDDWDDDDDKGADTGEKKEVKTGEVIQVKKKKTFKEKIAEKEEQRKRDLEEKMAKKKFKEDEKKALTPKQIMEEKLRKQKIQEEDDLTLAIEAFGLDKDASKKIEGEIENLEPSMKEDFDKLSDLLREKFNKYESSPHFINFLENLFRDLVLGIDPDSIRKISSTLNALYKEKLKKNKSVKNKKKPKKASLLLGKDTEKALDNLDVHTYDDDYDDYI